MVKYEKFLLNNPFVPYSDFKVVNADQVNHRIRDFRPLDTALLIWLRWVLDTNQPPPFFLLSAATARKFRDLCNYVREANRGNGQDTHKGGFHS